MNPSLQTLYPQLFEHLPTGASLATAVLLPNVEFIFGLVGATASTIIAFVLPAAIFLRATDQQRGMLGHDVNMLKGA